MLPRKLYTGPSTHRTANHCFWVSLFRIQAELRRNMPLSCVCPWTFDYQHPKNCSLKTAMCDVSSWVLLMMRNRHRTERKLWKHKGTFGEGICVPTAHLHTISLLCAQGSLKHTKHVHYKTTRPSEVPIVLEGLGAITEIIVQCVIWFWSKFVYPDLLDAVAVWYIHHACFQPYLVSIRV